MTLRSSSVSPPSIMKSTSFPSRLAMSRTVRGKRLKIWFSGIIRMFIIMFWRSETERPIMFRVSSRSFIWCSRAISEIRPRFITRSSTRFIMTSSRLMSTRIFLTSRPFSTFSPFRAGDLLSSSPWAAGGASFVISTAGVPFPDSSWIFASFISDEVVMVFSASIPASLVISTSKRPSNTPSSTVDLSGVTFSRVPISSRFWSMIIARKFRLSQVSVRRIEILYFAEPVVPFTPGV
ncbi:MAG: hypothetical protein A4E42_01130 [Methanoregulaceae archaeon PtaU1.Bin222]|nr:MAG: hypothetical protein A4E42_01130 [Methanoregulaceae archaeon PtaU1.Bin222]